MEIGESAVGFLMVSIGMEIGESAVFDFEIGESAVPIPQFMDVN